MEQSYIHEVKSYTISYGPQYQFYFRFMFYLYDHLEEGSFKAAYADTDSMCLGLSRTIQSKLPAVPEDNLEKYHEAVFGPLVKPSMRESWEKTWKQWFVTTKQVEDQRLPGKLKLEFSLSRGHFIGLSPKCYYCFNFDDREAKLGTKGVPHYHNLQLPNFLDKLYGQKDLKIQLRSLRLLGGAMSRVHIDKRALSDLFSKFHISFDGITCTPLKLNDQYL